MKPEIPADLQRLHQLAWRAGAWMDDGWWHELGLSPWRQSYLQHPACRPALDRLIAQRRGFPQTPLPATLTAQQQAMLALEPRLPRLLAALGLLAMACPDYLLLGRYRRPLAASLGERACDQLLALGVFAAPRPPDLAPEQVAAAALDLGTRWWRSGNAACPARTALSILQPPGPAEAMSAMGDAIPWLMRIGRFL
ncbi:hypothetical protein CXB49_07530 [Chromobacterium sp. ATCC 53434]|uniref:type III secretion system domain-containing protein n=1 Tax=Chromobacterium sp. (strain ATCC 53434 / SC 14030) TaxID=2059672 RepID=UPI000C771F03|nr:type III secretion system domain-containing protein [Chromobacterium sp. ATCC 53434]AUH50662.1 hypothetical protein CXB49_07530 [Chromobacterium sp. ATCC 53434]